jgi:HD superfamily phosphohydrolase
MNRDARYCGVPYGVQDVDFILSKLYPNKDRGVDIDSRLIPNLEARLFSKYMMYRTIYWHRQVRSATAMIKKALISGLQSGKLSGEALYNLDDSSLFSLLNSKNQLPITSKLASNVSEGRIFITAAEFSLSKLGFFNISAIRKIDHRLHLEEKIAKELKKNGLEIETEDIIIDIPESMSFETGLFVLDEENDFSCSSSAFKTEIVDAFVQTLYTIRIYINQKFVNNLKTINKLYDTLLMILNDN